MSHHSSNPDIYPEMHERMKQFFGEFPDGKLNKDDEGALAVAITTEGNAVKLVFPKPVAWIGFTADQAMQIAEDLIKHARKLGHTRPLSIHL